MELVVPSRAAPNLQTALSKGVGLEKTGGSDMFVVTGFDTSGTVNLKRFSFESALKKARELINDGCWDVEIVDPEGRVYAALDQLAA
jgi:hypothetical protein